MVNKMWRKHRRTLQYHVKYICNGSVNPFRFVILHYSEQIHEMHNLANYLPPTSMKGREYDETDWNVCDKELADHEICATSRGELPTSMKDELDDKIQDKDN